jgi:hypothetical protein
MLLALLLLGASAPEIYTKADATDAGAQPVTLFGTVRQTSDGTALVLDDGSAILITTDAPPPPWASFVGKYVRVTGTLNGNRLGNASPPAPAARSLKKLQGKKVELHGIAEDAKSGAILLVDGEPIYLRNKDAWPAGKRGKSVVVKGTLTWMKLIPSPVRGPDGAISQGAEGSQWVLEGATD